VEFFTNISVMDFTIWDAFLIDINGLSGFIDYSGHADKNEGDWYDVSD
jgi:hypothetical protein